MRLLRGFWKILVGVKDALVLLFMLIFFGGLYALLSVTPKPIAESTGALVLDLDGTLVEQPAQTDTLGAIAGGGPATREYRLRDMVRALEAAAKDSGIKAVVLDLDSFAGGGQATLAAAAKALDTVRAANKPVLAYATGYTDDSYQLAAHASEVWLNPFGAVLLTGPGGSNLYYKGLLDKIGVETKVYRVGEFKSAIEPYTRTEQSPEARAANQALADSLWATWQADVLRARPRARLASYLAQPEQAIATAGGDIAKAALDAGLVDKIGDRVAFGRRVAQLAGDASDGEAGDYRAVPFDGWLAANAEPSGGQIGVLTIAGEIVDGDAAPGRAGGDTIAGLLLDELAKDRIKALVVRVDSPGGSVTGSERIRDAILEAKRKKLPIVVSMGTYAASGGYWVSTPGDIIFAEPSTVTGSIGVFGLLPNFSGALAKIGVSVDGVKTTPLSGEPDLLRGTSPEFDRLMQAGIDDIYRRFTGLVAQSRKLPVTRVDEIGQGRVWAGSTAVGLRLVDKTGGLEDAIAEAARRAKIDPKSARPLFIERSPSLVSQILSGLFQSEEQPAARDVFTRIARQPEQRMLRAFHDLKVIADGPVIQVRCLECPVADTRAPPRRADLVDLLLARIGL
ncbi:protease-4 [Sphingomonas laterariae]|uniref:Protease-4 n=1 Tax=Edaphosphingomonas laterariae TaxID=861865 RepID=A0A239KI85_9SPHN|nr:signal peptide peptidase SppA [Sphingomonas laterariae]SNT17319.1 protease-4 [Sphingomonas laterariae]